MFDGNSLKNSSLEGKVAIVTGSTQGLGEGVAHLFADRGISGLVITGRNAERGAKVKADLEARGVKTVFVAADLASMDDTRKVVAEADKAFGRVDMLVNSAGITDRGTIWDTKPELFDAMFAVNVRAPFFLMQDALTVMKREKIEGSIVNIISMSGHGGQSFITAYCASKGGADHADPERRLFGDEPPHPRQRPDHRPHEHAGRGPHHEDLSRRRGRLARAGREDQTVRPPARSRRSGARRRLSLQRGERHDDGLDHRLRPAGARRRQFAAARRRRSSPRPASLRPPPTASWRSPSSSPSSGSPRNSPR